MASITFLGTGGGRFVLLTQKRHTGGLWLELESTILVDPGPGSLIRALEARKDAARLDAVLVSHNHIDHCNDASLMVEAMTAGMKEKKGSLVLNRSALDYVSDYHKGFIDLIVPEEGKRFRIGELEIEALPTHNHEGASGFKFLSRYGTITYTADTAYSEEVVKHYRGSDVLLMNTIFPGTKKIDVHLNSRDAVKILRKAKPKLGVMNHFGRTMLSVGPDKEASWVSEESGVKAVAAVDGMVIDLPSLHTSRDDEKQKRLGGF